MSSDLWTARQIDLYDVGRDRLRSKYRVYMNSIFPRPSYYCSIYKMLRQKIFRTDISALDIVIYAY